MTVKIGIKSLRPAALLLLRCCDFRLMKADRGYFFFPEVDLNIPFLPSMQEMIKKTFPYYITSLSKRP